jgi:hypothetical protein
MKASVDRGTGIIFDKSRPWLGGNIFGGDPRCFDKGVFDFLIQKYKPESIFDVGCGEGHLMDYFHKNGIKVYGSDGLEDNKENAVPTIKSEIVIHDYVKGPLQPVPVDMVLSCEFVEHVHQIFIANFLPQFIACKVLVFTHAVPDQPGHHHVNCQSDEYWIDLLAKSGMVWLKEETDYARSLVKSSFWGTLLIFKPHKV